jgi:hypothetical protein
MEATMTRNFASVLARQRSVPDFSQFNASRPQPRHQCEDRGSLLAKPLKYLKALNNPNPSANHEIWPL